MPLDFMEVMGKYPFIPLRPFSGITSTYIREIPRMWENPHILS
jgi:hypothetical protein